MLRVVKALLKCFALWSQEWHPLQAQGTIFSRIQLGRTLTCQDSLLQQQV